MNNKAWLHQLARAGGACCFARAKPVFVLGIFLTFCFRDSSNTVFAFTSQNTVFEFTWQNTVFYNTVFELFSEAKQ